MSFLLVCFRSRSDRTTGRHAHRNVSLHAVVHRVRFHVTGRVRDHPAVLLFDNAARRDRHAPHALLALIGHAALAHRTLALFRHHPTRRDRHHSRTHFRHLLHDTARLVADVIFLHQPTRRVTHLPRYGF